MPGFLWVHGRWAYPAVHVEGRWERRGRGHVWIDGGWRPRSGVVVHRHR